MEEGLQRKIEEMFGELKTEADFWEAIRSYNTTRQAMRHELARDHSPNPNNDTDAVAELTEVITMVRAEICRRFNIVSPADTPRVAFGKELPPPPAGMRYYHSWYQEIERTINQQRYKETICSGCPFSQGMKYFDYMAAAAPCGRWSGFIRLEPLNVCSLLRFADPERGGFTLAGLKQAITDAGGDAVVTKCRQTTERLQTPAEYCLPD